MKLSRLLFFLFFLGFFVASCSKDDDVVEPKEKKEGRNVEVEEFIYAGMSDIYLYKADVVELTDGYFSSNDQVYDFFRSFDTPEEFFYDGVVASQDEFSFLVDDYVELEKSFSGVATATGVNYILYGYSNSDDLFGLVRYIVPGSNADGKDIERGDIFTHINEQALTRNNYSDLLSSNEVTFHLATINNNTVTPTSETVSISSQVLTENPILLNEVLEIGESRVGYVMYNSFVADFDDELNNAFSELKGQGITDLVIDLRYNGGGSVESAVDLSSMITGQFEGEIFLQQQWNERYQKAWDKELYYDRFNNVITIDRGTDQEREELINSLKLDQVYILTTQSSASASELVINGLNAYIDVVHIGESTTGKYQASVTLYDSPGMLTKDGINTDHTYAIQPLIYKSANALGESDYVDGLTPDFKVPEDITQMGILGDPEEPLLKAALNHIQGLPVVQEEIAMAKRATSRLKIIGESGMNELNYQRMYSDKLPQPIQKGRE